MKAIGKRFRRQISSLIYVWLLTMRGEKSKQPKKGQTTFLANSFFATTTNKYKSIKILKECPMLEWCSLQTDLVKTGEPSWAECFAINQFETSHGSKLSLSSKLTLNILPLIIRKIVPEPPKSGRRVRWPHVAKLRGLFFLSKASWRMMLNDNPGRKVSFYCIRRPSFLIFYDILKSQQ